MSLLSLPNEMISQIIRRVTGDDNFPCSWSLSRLCLCSHLLYHLTKPILYSRWQVTTHRPLPLLFVDIWQDPRVASYVETFETFRREPFSFDTPSREKVAELFWGEGNALQGLLKRDLDSQIRQLCREGPGQTMDVEKWIEAVRLNVWDATVSLAICACHKLRYLKIRLDSEFTFNAPGKDDERQNYLDHTFRRAASLQKSPGGYSILGSLRNLHTVEVEIFGCRPVSISQIFNLLALPSVRTFYGSECDIHWNIHTPVLFHNIKTLHFQEIRIADADMGRVMGAFVALEVLHIACGTFSRLSRYIQHLRHCLRRLTLEDHGIRNFVEDPNVRSRFGNFHKLEYLSLSARCISGWVADGIKDPETLRIQEASLPPLEEVIPQNVEVLYLVSCGPRFLAKFSAMLSRGWFAKSRLRSLEIHIFLRSMQEDQKLKDDYTSVCKELGIEFRVI